MGCGSSGPVVPKDDQNDEVERMLQQAQEEENNHYKLLLLGAGESGKSTVVKQLKLIYKVKVSEKEKQEYASAIRGNTLECFRTVLEAMDTLNITCADESINSIKAKIMELDGGATFDYALVGELSKLHADSGFQECLRRQDEYWLLDAHVYYFDNMERFADDDFDPTEEDMIMTRVRTTGIVCSELSDPPMRFTVVDVGGQRSERRKWIHCFDDVKAVIFLEGLAGYHQVLFEDQSQNRMHESLALFREVVKNPIFKDTPIFLALNKKDLFEEMIVKTPLTVCFPEYEGEEGKAMPALDYIKAQYQKIMDEECPGKEVFISIIAARVRMDMKIMFADVKENLKKIYHGGKKK
eukprot:CAMPEP_0119464418 /NCGR_PEP_ID=MMETSP1344-20130328/25_1 /TAXON_ID=236787 /ORGANISM="Florenciella parvula, Strain CCMP2471" /LENGTH=352 /DNA_ID=CAMNT_0007496627 /DNA_START=332 /DNA_END=1390 /DNA_ORIENTATION=+